jgi:hypothetical protein
LIRPRLWVQCGSLKKSVETEMKVFCFFKGGFFKERVCLVIETRAPQKDFAAANSQIKRNEAEIFVDGEATAKRTVGNATAEI